MKNEVINIFDYNDPSLFLRDHWLSKKKNNENFSIRAWSLHLGIKSHSQLHEMIYGKRTIPRKYFPSIIKNLKLKKREADYLESLLNIQRAKSTEEKLFHFDKIKSFSPQEPIAFAELDQCEMIKNPLHFFLLEIFSLKNTSLSIEDIRNKMHFEYSNQEIKRAIETLTRLELLKETGLNTYKKTKNHFFTKSDIPRDAIRMFHKSIIDISKKAIDQQSVDEREFNSTTLNISSDDLPRAKELIREFRERFINEFGESENEKDSTYQLNLNFFAITKKS